MNHAQFEADPAAANDGLLLEQIVFQHVSLNRSTEEDGVITPLKGKFNLNLQAAGSLTVKTSPKNGRPYIVAIMTVSVDVLSDDGQSDDGVANCKVGLQGFFSSENDTSAESLKILIDESTDLFQKLGSSLYPVAIREIKQRLMDAGLPPPNIRLSLPEDDEK